MFTSFGASGCVRCVCPYCEHDDISEPNKIVGLPELNTQETAMDMSKLCAKLFTEMGTSITLQDIVIAHCVPLRSAGDRPKAIIYSFQGG